MKQYEGLKDSEITRLISQTYLDNRFYRYAVLIDGAWGCGKSYYIENGLMRALNERDDRVVVYLSLYGISSRDEFEEKLCAEMLRSRPIRNYVMNGGKFTEMQTDLPVQGLRFSLNIVAGMVAQATTGVLDEIGSETRGRDVFRNFVFVLDDLERAHCDISEILGLINDLVERQAAKAILVADETRIIHKNTDNLELKYMFASLANVKSEDGSTPEMLTRDQIVNRTEYLFGKNLEYLNTREKLIGMTIRYHQDDLSVTLKHVIANALSNDGEGESIMPEHRTLYRILTDDRSIVYFREKMDKVNCENLRMFQLFIDRTRRISRLTAHACPQEYEKYICYFVCSCFNACLRFVTGGDEFDDIWQNNNNIVLFDDEEKMPRLGSRVTDAYIREQYNIRFKFVDYMIWYNAYRADSAYTVDETVRKFRSYEGKLAHNAAYRKYIDWNRLPTDNEIAMLAKEMVSGEPDCAVTAEYLSILYNMRSAGVSVDREIAKLDEYMRASARAEKLRREDLSSIIYIRKPEEQALFNEKITSLNRLLDGYDEERNARLFRALLINDEYDVESNYGELGMDKNRLFRFITDEAIATLVYKFFQNEEGVNVHIIGFTHVVEEQYNRNTIFPEERIKMTKLRDALNEEIGENRLEGRNVQKYNLMELIDLLSKKIELPTTDQEEEKSE